MEDYPNGRLQFPGNYDECTFETRSSRFGIISFDKLTSFFIKNGKISSQHPLNLTL